MKAKIPQPQHCANTFQFGANVEEHVAADLPPLLLLRAYVRLAQVELSAHAVFACRPEEIRVGPIRFHLFNTTLHQYNIMNIHIPRGTYSTSNRTTGDKNCSV